MLLQLKKDFNLQINGNKFVSPVGFFDENWKLVNMTQGGLKNLVSRRSNFQGIQLVSMTELQKPFNVFDSSFSTLANFDPQNQTYQMRNFTQGLFFELFQILESKLNFTGVLLKRKDGNWGAKDANMPNGNKLKNIVFFSLKNHGISVCFFCQAGMA